MSAHWDSIQPAATVSDAVAMQLGILRSMIGDTLAMHDCVITVPVLVASELLACWSGQAGGICPVPHTNAAERVPSH